MRDRIEAWGRDANAFIRDHPVVSVLLWFLLTMVVVTGSAPVIPSGKPHYTLTTWVAITGLPMVAVDTMLMPTWTRRPPAELVAMRWSVAQLPWLLGFVAAFTGGPQWPGGVGTIEALVLMLLALRGARRSSGPTGSTSEPATQ